MKNFKIIGYNFWNSFSLEQDLHNTKTPFISCNNLKPNQKIFEYCLFKKMFYLLFGNELTIICIY